jgi:hypothetical protein
VKNRGTRKRDYSFIFTPAGSFRLSLPKGEGTVRIAFWILHSLRTPHLDPLPLRKGERREENQALSLWPILTL